MPGAADLRPNRNRARRQRAIPRSRARIATGASPRRRRGPTNNNPGRPAAPLAVSAWRGGRSAGLYRRARRRIPRGVNSPVRYYGPHPLFVGRAEGPHVWDADGRRYVDLCCGYGAVVLGHARREIVGAAARAAARGPLFCAPTEAEVELSEEISSLYPSAERVRLVNTGGEATMVAVRLARGFTGKDKVIKFDGCYHGAHDSMLAAAGSGSADAAPSSAGVPAGAARDTVVVPFNDVVALEGAVGRCGGDLAGVIMEPVMGNMGVIPPERGFLRAVRRITRAAGVPLVFDETITGFRLSEGGAQKAYGVRPDVTTLGKALGGGFPIAAVCGRADIMESLAPAGPVYQASTFAGNPVSVAAALASVRIIRRRAGRMYPELRRKAAALASAASDAAAAAGLPHAVNAVASMFQVFFADGPVRDAAGARGSDRAAFARMFGALLSGGIYAAPSGSEAAMITAAHGEAELRRAAEAYHPAMREAARGR